MMRAGLEAVPPLMAMPEKTATTTPTATPATTRTRKRSSTSALDPPIAGETVLLGSCAEIIRGDAVMLSSSVDNPAAATNRPLSGRLGDTTSVASMT